MHYLCFVKGVINLVKFGKPYFHDFVADKVEKTDDKIYYIDVCEVCGKVRKSWAHKNQIVTISLNRDYEE